MDDVMVARAAASTSGEADAVRERTKAIAEHKKLAKVLDDCKFCFGTSSHQKHLMIAIGKTWYIRFLFSSFVGLVLNVIREWLAYAIGPLPSVCF
jgi:hypothetical protein